MVRAVTQRQIDTLSAFLRTFQASSVPRKFTLHINRIPVGLVRASEAAILAENTANTFCIDESKEEIHLDTWKSFDEITQGLSALLREFRAKKLFVCLEGWRNELVAVSQDFNDTPMFLIERSATPLFGIKRYGVHINGFVKKNDEIESVWLQRRSKTKEQFPGLLDIIVSGGLEAGSTPREAAYKECFEEASIPADLCEKLVKPVGSVSFVYGNDLGTHPLTFFCYDASFPADFEPKANDGEVEEFTQVPIGDLLDLVMDPKRFKVTSAPTVLNFLIRHHLIDSTYGSTLMNTASTIHQNLQEHYPNLPMRAVQQQVGELQKVLKFFVNTKTLVADGYVFQVAGRAVGFMRPGHWHVLSEHSDAFKLEERTVKLEKWMDPEHITRNLREIMKKLCTVNAFPGLRAWRNEEYDVAAKFGDEPLFRIERSMTYIFGLKRYGVHINGYTIDSDGNRFVWLQRRARTKAEYPGKLDTMVGGGLESGKSVDDCMKKEAFEEASISRDQIENWSRPVGHVSFLYEDANGLSPETLFCYDALLPEGFQPKNNDGEVDEFVRVPLGDLLDVAMDRERYNITSLPAILDFLIRHHMLDHKFGPVYFQTFTAIHEDLYNDYPPKSS